MNDWPLIYIAGPYSKGDPEANTLRALLVAERVLECSGVPFVPHLSHWWHKVHPKPLDFWYNLDFRYLEMCDGVLRMTGESDGADGEVLKAVEWRKPIWFEGELFIKDFRFPRKAPLSCNHELAKRSAYILQTCKELDLSGTDVFPGAIERTRHDEHE